MFTFSGSECWKRGTRSIPKFPKRSTWDFVQSNPSATPGYAKLTLTSGKNEHEPSLDALNSTLNYREMVWSNIQSHAVARAGARVHYKPAALFTSSPSTDAAKAGTIASAPCAFDGFG